MSLDRDIEGFALAHESALSARDLFVLGQAAGIVARVHAPYLGSTFQPRTWRADDPDGPTAFRLPDDATHLFTRTDSDGPVTPGDGLS